MNVELTRIRRLSGNTYDFRFEGREEISFTPGQFFRFTFEDREGEFERSYSLCNLGDEAGVLDLVISTVEGGRATALLFNAKTGLKATAVGPFGRLILPKKLPERLFLVATSVGIAPYMPMLAQLAELSESVEVFFLYGTRNESEFIYSEELRLFARTHVWFHLFACYSQQADNLLEDEFNGYVQEKIMFLEPNPATDHFLLCGNPMMIDEVYGNLKLKEFGVRQVVREKYVFAKRAQEKQNKKKPLSAEQQRLLIEKMKKYQQ